MFRFQFWYQRSPSEEDHWATGHRMQMLWKSRTWCSEAHLGIFKCPDLAYNEHKMHHPPPPLQACDSPGSSSGANKVTANGELLWVPVQEEVVEHLRSHCSLDAILTPWTVPILFGKSPLSPSPLNWIPKQSNFSTTRLACGHHLPLNPAAIRQMKTAPKVAHELISCGVATVPFPQGC